MTVFRFQPFTGNLKQAAANWNNLLVFPLVLIVLVASSLLIWNWHIEKANRSKVLAGLEQHIRYTSENYWNYNSFNHGNIALRTIKGEKQKYDNRQSVPDTEVILKDVDDNHATLQFNFEENLSVSQTLANGDYVPDTTINGIKIRLLAYVRKAEEHELTEMHVCTLKLKGSNLATRDTNKSCQYKGDSGSFLQVLNEEYVQNRNLYTISLSTENRSLVGISFIIHYQNLQKEDVIISQKSEKIIITSYDSHPLNKNEFLPTVFGDSKREYYIAVYRCHSRKYLPVEKSVICDPQEDRKASLLSTYTLNTTDSSKSTKILEDLIGTKANKDYLYPAYRRNSQKEEKLPKNVGDLAIYAIGLKIINPSDKWYYPAVLLSALALMLSWVYIFRELEKRKSNLESRNIKIEKQKYELERKNTEIEESNQTLSEKNAELEKKDNKIALLKSRVVHDTYNHLIQVKLNLKRYKDLRKADLERGMDIPQEEIEILKDTREDIKYIQAVLNVHSNDNLREYVNWCTNNEYGRKTPLRSTIDLCVKKENQQGHAVVKESYGPDSYSCEIHGNKQHFRIAFSNILKNAATHSSGNSSKGLTPVHVNIGKTNDQVAINIWNQVGEQVDLADTEKWFRDGYSTKKQSEANGKGMGLFHAREIVQGLDGSLDCQETWRGEQRGVEFCIRLPLDTKLEPWESDDDNHGTSLLALDSLKFTEHMV